MPAPAPPYEPEDILGQAFMAFGQGAGTMIATPVALRLARKEYGRLLRPDDWDVQAPRVLDYARSLGRVSAHLALTDGASAIDLEHIRRAFKLVRGRARYPFDCPYCPPSRPGGRQSLPAGGTGPNR